MIPEVFRRFERGENERIERKIGRRNGRGEKKKELGLNISDRLLPGHFILTIAIMFSLYPIRTV